MTSDSSQPESSRTLTDADLNRQLTETIKKMQAEMDSLRSENTILRKERTTERSRSINRPRRPLLNVVRHLDMNAGEDDRPPEETFENEEPPPEDEEEGEGDGRHDERREDNIDDHHSDHERRRSRHRSSRSYDKVPKLVKKELNEFREVLQRISGAPKPMEKATPTSYADSPFSDDIALVDIPKRFAVPPMKSYDGSTDPLEHIAQYKQRIFTIPITRDLRGACMCKGFGAMLAGLSL